LFRQSDVQIDVPSLVETVEGGRQSQTRVLAGSVPVGFVEKPNSSWAIWRALTYNVLLAQRAAGVGEQFVDEALHSTMSRVLLSPQLKNAGQTMVLLTGDGNDTVENTMTFPLLVEAAVDAGWNVEVWAWNRSISRKFRDLAREYPAHIRICPLDEHRDLVVYKYTTT
jgi:hypothetical protein